MQTSDGGPSTAVHSAANQLGAQMAHQQTAYVQWVGRMETILLSDYGKLSTVGTAVGSDLTWAWQPSTTIDSITALEAGARASAYSALIPVAYGGYNLKPGTTLTGSNDTSSYICDQPNYYNPHDKPFAPVLAQNQFHAATSFSTGGQQTDQAWVIASLPEWSTHSAQVITPTASLTDNIYGPQSTGSSGAYQYEPSWWRSTFNPPGHVTCNQYNSELDVNTLWSNHYPPPSIPPPLP